MALLIACGDQASNSKKVINVDPSEFPSFLEDQQFSCAPVNSAGPCPLGIARIFVLNAEKPVDSSLCSGFLLTPTKLMTNHHCVSSQEQCGQTLVSVFAGRASVSAKCAELLVAEDDGPDLLKKSVDFAILELDRAIELPEYFHPAKTSPLPGDSLRVWVIDHLDLLRARITELQCTFRGKEISMELRRCPAIVGNSGSPVLNERQELAGILWGTTFDERINEKTSLKLRRSLPVRSYFTEFDHFSYHFD
jgi:hypothetical protein